MKKLIFVSGALVLSLCFLGVSSYLIGVPIKFHTEGEKLDELKGVEVYYNGGFNHVSERNVTESGYNVGLRWQCVEFVKRFYLEVYNHEMPDSNGNAVDYYDSKLKDGEINDKRGLVQFLNPSYSSPRVGDIVVFSGKYGHVAVVSDIFSDGIEVIQQNVGLQTREFLEVRKIKNKFEIRNSRVLCRLRMR